MQCCDEKTPLETWTSLVYSLVSADQTLQLETVEDGEGGEKGGGRGGEQQQH